ncbi:MAG TPA: phosphate ABC transporter permease PstA [Bryobacteraceae bacterium]|jgi:phosphate transport system permease protein|nr:phosphate ABC transporter permease PstA [Bryobacteraceae bacterium]
MDRIARRNIVNYVMLAATGICTVITVSVLFLILGYLVVNGWRSLDWNFFTKLPLSAGEAGGGVVNALVGSGVLILIAALIGIPVGFLGGIYLAEFGGKTVPMMIRYTADLLNGVPSIVIGIFAWTVIVVRMHHFSAWAGGFALSLMMIPIGLRATEQFLRGVPNSLREGSLALGASKTRTIISVIVPAAKQGILTGMILGVARIAGETAPLLFTSLNNQFWATSLNQPTASLPVLIYNYAISAYDDLHREAWAAGLVLLILVLIANIASRWVLSRGASTQRG